MAIAAVTRRFTAAEYHRMAEVGILKPDDRVELIDGEIVAMASMSSRHAAAVRKIAALWQRSVGGTALVSVQCPVRLDDYSEPEPDVAILRPEKSNYAEAHPRAADVLLLIEVAHTSLDLDREIKIPCYARTGVSETWLVNLESQQVELFRAPAPAGYADRTMARRGERIAPRAIPGHEVLVDDLLA